MDTRIGDTVDGGGGGGGDKPKKQSAEDRIAAKPFGREIIAAAKANSVDPALFAALVAQESGFNQRAVSRSGALDCLS
jgi:soluble lytic murein transglycosylase-like protein